MNGSITPLPEAMIQHIQSFLTGKEAAQTTILSKSWYNAWLTRPNINLDENEFNDRTRGWGFHDFAEKTMKRYEESNLNIVSFKLSVDNLMQHNREIISLWTKNIVRAIKLGATDLEFKLAFGSWDFVLPHEVFEAENLIRLSVSNCKIGLGWNGKVNCSKLRFLSLRFVSVGDDIIGDIISICPMIEELVVSHCELVLKNRYSVYRRARASLATWFDGWKGFPNMKCLSLIHVNVGDLFFSDFSSKFPCLKELFIASCDGYKGVVIELSSPSLEHITFKHYSDMLRVKFNTPSIRKFTFWGDQLPSLCFEEAPSKWESSINIECESISTSWLLELSKLLLASNLSTSRVSFYLRVGKSFVENSFYHPGNVQALHILDSLILVVRPPFSSSLLQGLYLSFQPKFLTLHSKPLVELFCNIVVYEESDNCYVPNRKFDVEEFVESFGDWQGLPWHILLDASTNPKKERNIHFQLRWCSG